MRRKVALGIVCLVVGFGIGFATKGYAGPEHIPNKILREAGYEYIAPILICNINDPDPSTIDAGLRSKLSEYLSTQQEKDVAVSYRNFTKGTWAGVSEDENFSPASMLKIPTMVAIYRYSESRPGFLNKEIFYDGSFDDNKAEHFKPAQAILPQHSYTVDTLVNYMIAYSDNNAARLLSSVLPPQDLEDIYKDLRIELPSYVGADFMSTKTYALFLRLLYGSTYLTRELSEKALKLLTSPDFPQGLIGGLPSDVKVAQKFGEREILSTTGEVLSYEVHDCGIVYVPQGDTYILCVMTRGKNIDTLTKEIKDISKLVYDWTTNK